MNYLNLTKTWLNFSSVLYGMDVTMDFSWATYLCDSRDLIQN